MRVELLACLLSLPLAQAALASPNIASGDLALRQDIQRLADYGVIRQTITTWPLAWGPLLGDLNATGLFDLPPAVADALVRVRARAERETRITDLRFRGSAGIAEKPTGIRSFQATPRGDVDVSAGFDWTGQWLSVDLNGQYVDSDQDDDEFRVDDSYVGFKAGNWSFGASTLQRWWGPAWDGSLILSNNARPFPSLEIGLSRSAQWCGDGHPCDLDTFTDLPLARDNRGDQGINPDNEPSNQLAGVDFRWVPPFGNRLIAVYGQYIGEDEAGAFPAPGWASSVPSGTATCSGDGHPTGSSSSPAHLASSTSRARFSIVLTTVRSTRPGIANGVDLSGMALIMMRVWSPLDSVLSTRLKPSGTCYCVTVA